MFGGEAVVTHSCWTEQQRKEHEALEGAIRIQASQINNLIMKRDALRKEYSELVDALCSPAWLGRNRHSSVVALAKRLHDSQRQLRPLELEDVALAAGYCIRKSGHNGPCNGLPRNDCFVSNSEKE